LLSHSAQVQCVDAGGEIDRHIVIIEVDTSVQGCIKTGSADIFETKPGRFEDWMTAVETQRKITISSPTVFDVFRFFLCKRLLDFWYVVPCARHVKVLLLFLCVNDREFSN